MLDDELDKAEQVRGNEVVNSAIFELRYAGRKIVDALQLIMNKDWKNDRDVYEKIRRYLGDAIEDCVKSKHDAIDAMIDFVTTWFNHMEGRIGLSSLVGLFPDYIEITSRIAAVQDKIAHSREHRAASRDGVYDEIENEDYDAILALYNRMRLSRDRVQKISNWDWWHRVANMMLTVVIALGTVLLVGFEVARLLHD
jgi:hypothetical protein